MITFLSKLSRELSSFKEFWEFLSFFLLDLYRPLDSSLAFLIKQSLKQ